MADNLYPNDQIRQLQQQNQQLADENLKLRTELEAYKIKIDRKVTAGKAISWTGAGIFMGKRLKKSLEQLYAEIPRKEFNRETLATVTAHVLWRFTRIRLVSILFAIIPAAILILQTFMMMRQTTTMERQSDIMKTQNELVETQNTLIQNQIGSEDINAKKGIYSGIVADAENTIRNRSGRSLRNEGDVINFGKSIASAVNKIEPYELGPGGKNVSPELGQILLSFVNKAKQEANLKRFAYLVYAEAIFNYADLEEKVLNNAPLKAAFLSNSNLTKAVLRGADLENTQLNQAILDEAIITNANLFATNLNSARAQGAQFNASKMRNAKFAGADLTGADFRGVYDLDNADFTEAILLNVKVSEANWLRKMADKNIKGWDDIRNVYRVNSEELRDGNGTYYVIEER